MKPSPSTIEAEIRAQVAARGRGRTICPSEVARALSADWRPLMAAVREGAAELAERGEIRVTQRGQPVDARLARGPIRLGLP